MPKFKAKIECPSCNKKVLAYRASDGRILITTVAGLSLAIFGAVIGSGIGIASGGWAAPATIPLAAIGLVVGAGLGYTISDKTMDKPTCPNCNKPLDFGF